MDKQKSGLSRKGSGPPGLHGLQAHGFAHELPSWELEAAREVQTLRTFSPSLAAFGVVFLGLLFGLSRYAVFDDNPSEQIDKYYQWFIGVNIMVWVGFGFLMTFLRRYSFGAVCLNMVASVVMFLEAILWLGATQQVFWNQKASFITIDMPLLIDCAFCAASGMIAFGAVIGKVTPTQLLWLVFAQVPLYGLNQHLVIHTFKALDAGGTLCIHLFGAYYGLAASLVLRTVYPLTGSVYGPTHPKFTSSYLNDVFSMIGTLFLWLYWPSFNGALAAVPVGHDDEATDAERTIQFLCVVNTLLSLMGATLSTFAASALVGRGRINMMHIQNSTLAGGVAMGAACSLQLTPGGAVITGMAAGVLSVCGYQYLTPYLERKGLGDTCGVHNLHGMPSILGGLVAGLAALGQKPEYLMQATGSLQLGYQVCAMAVTVAIAVAGGLIVGYLLTALNPTKEPHLQHIELFDDGLYWHGLRLEPLAPTVNIDASKHSCYSVSRHQPGGTVHRTTNGTAHGAAFMGVGGSHHSLEASQHRHLFVPIVHPAAVQMALSPSQSVPAPVDQNHLGVHVVQLGVQNPRMPIIADSIPENRPAV